MGSQSFPLSFPDYLIPIPLVSPSCGKGEQGTVSDFQHRAQAQGSKPNVLNQALNLKLSNTHPSMVHAATQLLAPPPAPVWPTFPVLGWAPGMLEEARTLKTVPVQCDHGNTPGARTALMSLE